MNRRLTLLLTAFLAIPLASCTGPNRMGAKPPADMESTPLIARDVLFGNPDRARATISPDGAHLAFLAERDGVMNVWIASVDRPTEARPVTQDQKRGIRNYWWAFDNQHILYPQDTDGDENWHLYATNINTNETKDLTPLEGVQARLQHASHKFPNEVVLAINDRNKELHDLYRVNIETGERRLVMKNDGFVDFTVDDDFKVRLAAKTTPDGGTDLYKPGADGAWAVFSKIPADDALTSGPEGFDQSGAVLYMIDSRERDTSALYAWNLDTNAKTLLSEDSRADVDDVLKHPTQNTVQAVAFNYERKEWKVLDDAVRGDMAYLRQAADGDIEITGRSLDDRHWIVAYVMDNGPVRYYHFDRPAHRAQFLFTNREKLERLPLARMHPVIVKARDGLELVSYLSLPVWADRSGRGRPKAPLPMVLNVHGGPWARDTWGLDAEHQWLTNRGYAVLSVNYRSSTGFGKKFINAGNKEWAAAMHDDLLDAVDWAVKNKIADPDKVAIYGGSYGGYATLVGLTFTPKQFVCGVDIVGPSNLATLLNSIPPYWKPMMDVFCSRVGDPRTTDGKKLLEDRSPLTHVGQIQRPLLIAQGAHDPRVKQAESDQIVRAMKEKKIPVTYVLFPDEGHGFARPQNRLAFYAIAEEFLSRHLGGRYESVGNDFEGSSVTVPQGADDLPGMKTALALGDGAE